MNKQLNPQNKFIWTCEGQKTWHEMVKKHYYIKKSFATKTYKISQNMKYMLENSKENNALGK